jgi:hypothetical protein
VSHYKPPYVLYLLLAGDFDSTAGTARTDNITQTSKD